MIENELDSLVTAVASGAAVWISGHDDGSISMRETSQSLSGSIDSAQRRFASVYSWALYISVLSGNFLRLHKVSYILSVVPSKIRPQPKEKRVSPVNKLLSL